MDKWNDKTVRGRIVNDLRAFGYTIVETTSDISDPFAWTLTAKQDGYEITIREFATLPDR